MSRHDPGINTKPLKVVLADDDEDDRSMFKEAIEEIPIHTNLLMFNNGEELMEYLKRPGIELPDLVFLDLNMPIKSGMQCLKEMRCNPALKDISVAIYSTSSSERDIEATFVNGANIYLNKPNNFNKLQESIEKVLQINWQYHTSNLNRDNFLFRL